MAEKVNKIERLKKALLPFDFAGSLERVDWENPDEETRFYLKNYGIYNIKLKARSYMLRIRSDGGRVELKKLATLCRFAQRYRLRLVVTARAQLELHDIEAADIWSIYSSLLEEGFELRQTLTDNFRAVVTDPFDAIAEDSRIEAYPIIERISSRFIGSREWMGTIPRKFNSAVIGRESPLFNPWGNDLLMALAERDGVEGFNLYLGGKNSHTALSADIFLDPEMACGLFFAVVGLYREEGFRGSRSKTRFRYLIDEKGMEYIRCAIEDIYGSKLEGEGELLMRSSFFSSTEGISYMELPLHYGEFTQEAIELVLGEDGNTQVRLDPMQRAYLVKEGAKESRRQKPRVCSCVGSRYCPLSLWDIKRDIDEILYEKILKYRISIGFSGCLKGCGRHYHSDIGLIGLRTNLYADTERALRVFVGALEAPEPKAASMLYYSVPSRCIGALIEVLVEDFEKSGKESFESFSAEILGAYDEDFLRLWYIIRQLYELDDEFMELFFAGKRDRLLAHFEKLEGYPLYENIHDTIKELSHTLWDKKDTI